MSFKHGGLIVFGSGPGVGRNVAAHFAERGFEKVVLVSRNGIRLSQDASVVRSSRADTTVHEVVADVGDAAGIKDCLAEIERRLEETPVECVLFNAARTGTSDFFKFSPEDLESDIRLAVIGLFTVAQWAMPKLLSTAASGPRAASLLVTSGMLAKEPYPAMFSLATCKAGQYSLVHSLHKEFEPQGVHCGVIIIGGTVSGESKVTNPRNIATETWEMFSEPKAKGRFELVLADPAYAEHIKRRERQH